MSSRLHSSARDLTFVRRRSEPQPDGVRVAAVQMASGPNVAGNLKEAARLIEMAAEQGAKLVALPEYFPIMGNDERDKVKVREEQGGGPIQEFLSGTARRHGIWIVGGSVPLVASVPDKVRNTCLVYDDRASSSRATTRSTSSVSRWARRAIRSRARSSPARMWSVLDSPFGRIGLSICYDLRFPELYRAMKDVDLILVPSAFTETTGKAHWDTLIRARAIENLAYVLAPAQGGYHVNGRETHGDTMIVDPWGVVLDRLPRGSGVVVGTVNHEHARRLRNSLPALTHRTL